MGKNQFRVWYTLNDDRRFLDADSEYKAKLWYHNIKEYGCWYVDGNPSDEIQQAQTEQLEADLAQVYALPDGEPISVERFENANWFTDYGAHLKVKDIRKKGLPTFRDARFITLTTDPDRYPDPQRAYELGKRHLPQFVYLLSQFLGKKIPYCWKLEFHKNGFAHWHIVLIHREFIPFEIINKCWAKGRTDIKRVRNNDWEYLFKYVGKAVDLPDWVLDYEQIRFFQASRGFYTNVQPCASGRSSGEHKKGNEREKLTLGQKIEKWGRTVVIRRPGDRCRMRQVWADSFMSFFVDQGQKFCTEMHHQKASKRSFRGAWQVITSKDEVIWQMLKNHP